MAKALHVDTSLVSRWEKGERKPSVNQLMTIARILGVTLDYLLHGKVDAHFQFRSKKKFSSEVKLEIEKALVDAEMQLHYIDTCYNMSEQLPKLFALKMDFSYQHLQSIATQIRGTLKLNRIVTFDELKQALTEFNTHIFEWMLPWELSGLSYRNAFAVIFINSMHSKERMLFTLAHEFAHILFHLGPKDKRTISSNIASNREPEEREANAFASELLMPELILNQEIEKVGTESIKHTEILDSIAKYFNVSREALFYRLVEKKIFSWEEKKFYFTKPKDRPATPSNRVHDIDEQVSPEFLRLALQLYDNNKISAGKLKEWLFTDRVTLDAYLAQRSEKVEELMELEAE